MPGRSPTGCDPRTPSHHRQIGPSSVPAAPGSALEDGVPQDRLRASPGGEELGLRLHRPDRSRLLLYVSGELDRITAPLLAAYLEALLASEAQVTSLTIDLVGTTFVDIGGLNTLVDMHHRARAWGVLVRIGACRPQFARVLHVTRTVELMAAAPELSSHGRHRVRGRSRRRRRP